ncbi:MAG: BACON domain-containing protein [Bacteroides sp.]|nr:BACON domain-containing protein [Bacteroides sp.]
MKKFIYIFLTISGLTGLTACSDDESTYSSSESSIEIISSDVLFQAAAGEGTVEFSATGDVTVTTDRDWCTASISGNTVNVSVTENGNLEGRASLLTLYCGTDSVNVSVQQTGLIFQLSAGSSILTDSDEAHSLTYTVNTNVDLTISTDSDWFTASIDGDELTVTFTENTTGHIRTGTLTYASTTFSGEMEVTQYEFANDLAGDCYLIYYNSSGTMYSMAGELSETGLYLTEKDWTVALTFDSETMEMVIPNAQLAGTSGDYYVYDILGGGGYITYSTTVSADMVISYDSEEGVTYFELTDNGSWSSRAVERLYFYTFTGTPSSSTRVSNQASMYYPCIYRYDPTTTE